MDSSFLNPHNKAPYFQISQNQQWDPIEMHSIGPNSHGPSMKSGSFSSAVRTISQDSQAHSFKAGSFYSTSDQSQFNYVDTEPILASTSPRNFVPLALKRVFLVSMMGVIAILCVALAILYRYSETHLGLTTSSQQWHYIFRYGPTGILTIVAALWSKIEYRTKQLAPWKRMSKGFAPATRTLLLDFVSPLSIVALPLAIKTRQFAVVISIIGSFLLQVTIVISTGLLVLRDLPIQHTRAQLIASDGFDATAFNSSAVDTRSYLNFFAVADLNQSFPEETTDLYAFQSFNSSRASASQNYTLTATVDVFSADLQCEHGNGSIYYIPHSFGGGMDAATPDCSISVEPQQLTWDGWIGYMTIASCQGQTGENAQRFLVCTAHITYLPPETQPDGGTIWEQYEVDNTTCIMCKPTYTRTTGNVTVSGNSEVPSKVFVNENSANTPIPSLSAWQLGSAAFYSMSNTSAALNASTVYTDNTGFFQLMNYTSPLLQPWGLLDPDYLINGSRKAFSLLAAQVAKSNLMIPKTEAVSGSYEDTEARLLLQTASFAGMESLLVILLLIMGWLCMLHHGSLTPRDVGSLAGLSTILARGGDAIKTVRGTSHMTIQEMEKHLSRYVYRSSFFYEGTVPTFRIVSGLDDRMQKKRTHHEVHNTETIKWWQPYGLTFMGRATIFVAPLLLFIILQALLHRSENGGIGIVSDAPYIHYSWTFFPAIVSLGVAALFNAFLAGIQLLQPYHTLKTGGMPASASLFDDFNGQISLQTLWIASRRKHVALVAATISILCAPFLSIMVSGLYKTNYAARHYPTLLQVNGWFNSSSTTNMFETGGTTLPNSANENLLPSLIMYGNTTFPKWTTPNFALAQLDTTTSALNSALDSLGSSNAAPILSAWVPAVSGVLNCSVSSYQSNNWTATDGTPSLNISVQLPSTCSVPDYGSSFSTVSPTGLWSMTIQYEGGVTGQWQTFPNLALTECPTALAVFGKMDGELTVMLCKPYMEQMMVNVTFVLPGFDIYPTTPPEIEPSTASFFSKDSVWTLLSSASNDFNQFSDTLIPVNMPNSDPRIGTLDTFFQALLQSGYIVETEKANTSMLLDRYLGIRNSQSLLKGMQNLYGLVMAQLYNSQKRIPATTGDPIMATGNITTFDQQRLYQDTTSTYILEALLITMFVCGLIALFTLDMSPVLPKNPCSIAAIASLLTDSEFLALIPLGSEYLDDLELKQTPPFNGYLFNLSWWELPGSTQRRFGPDVGRADYGG